LPLLPALSDACRKAGSSPAGPWCGFGEAATDAVPAMAIMTITELATAIRGPAHRF
jgi:hypothetical protein